MRSKEGAVFFVINIVGNFGTGMISDAKKLILADAFRSAVFLDNGYWNKVNRLFPTYTHDHLVSVGRDTSELRVKFIIRAFDSSCVCHLIPYVTVLTDRYRLLLLLLFTLFPGTSWAASAGLPFPG